MLFISCDYKGDSKVPPTKFTIKMLGSVKTFKIIKVADYPSLAHAFAEIGKTIKEVTGGTEAITSSSIDYLFMDGLLSDADFTKKYNTPEINLYRKVPANLI